VKKISLSYDTVQKLLIKQVFINFYFLTYSAENILLLLEYGTCDMIRWLSRVH